MNTVLTDAKDFREPAGKSGKDKHKFFFKYSKLLFGVMKFDITNCSKMLF